MNAELALVELLQQNGRLTALVSDRIGPWTNVENADLPSVTYFRIGTTRSQHFLGADPLAFAMIQLDSRAADYKTAKNVSEQVRLAINAFVGKLGTKVIQGVWNESELDFQEQMPGQEVPIYGVQQEYKIAYSERIV